MSTRNGTSRSRRSDRHSYRGTVCLGRMDRGAQWWRQFGAERVLHGTAHDALMATPLVGAYFRKMGVLPAAPDSITAAVVAGHDVALCPGAKWIRFDRGLIATRRYSAGAPTL